MAHVNLPITSRTAADPNDFADVAGNDQAIVAQVNGGLDNTNIATSAAIAHSKLANATAGQLLIANASGVITGTAMSGDATISSAGALTIANNAVTGAKIADDVIGAYRTIMEGGGNFVADSANAEYHLDFGTGWVTTIDATGVAPASAPPMVYIDDADYAISGLNTRLRIRMQVHTNATDPGAQTFTVRLFPVTVAGAADTLTYTPGTVVAGSGASVVDAPASAITSAVGADFAVPADGLYVFGCNLSGALANNAAVAVTAQLQLHHI